MLFIRAAGEVIERLETGAQAMSLTRSAYVELLVQKMPIDPETGLPPWIDEQLQLNASGTPAA